MRNIQTESIVFKHKVMSKLFENFVKLFVQLVCNLYSNRFVAFCMTCEHDLEGEAFNFSFYNYIIIIIT